MKDAIEEAGATSKQQMGVVMKVVTSPRAAIALDGRALEVRKFRKQLASGSAYL